MTNGQKIIEMISSMKMFLWFGLGLLVGQAAYLKFLMTNDYSQAYALENLSMFFTFVGIIAFIVDFWYNVRPQLKRTKNGLH
jgi:hypothetical protein